MSLHQPQPAEAAPPGPSRLLQLPVEISTEIFKLVLPCPQKIHIVDSSPDPWNDALISPRQQPYYFCVAAPRGPFCSHFTDRCWDGPRDLHPGNDTLPELHLALFRTCRRVYDLAHHLLYTHTTFHLSALDARASASRLGCAFLQQIGPRARLQLTSLSVDVLATWRLNWGATLPHRQNPPVIYDAETDAGMPRVFQGEMKKMCGFLAEMPGLRRLALGFSLRNMLGWRGGVAGVPWVGPLLGLCEEGGFAGVVWLTCKRRVVDVSENRKALGRFMVELAGEMRRRRMRSGNGGGGAGWGADFGVRCVEYKPVPGGSYLGDVQMRVLGAEDCADCWNYSCRRHTNE